MFEFIEYWLRKLTTFISGLYQESLDINFRAFLAGLFLYMFIPESIQLTIVSAQKLFFSQNEVNLSFLHHLIFMIIDLGFAFVASFIIRSVDDSVSKMDVILFSIITILFEIVGIFSSSEWYYFITAVLLPPSCYLGYIYASKKGLKFRLSMKSFFIGAIVYIALSKILTFFIGGMLVAIFNDNDIPDFVLTDYHKEILNNTILFIYIFCSFLSTVIAYVITKKDRIQNVLLMGSVPLFYSVYFFKRSPELRVLDFISVTAIIVILPFLIEKISKKKIKTPPPLPKS